LKKKRSRVTSMRPLRLLTQCPEESFRCQRCSLAETTFGNWDSRLRFAIEFLRLRFEIWYWDWDWNLRLRFAIEISEWNLRLLMDLRLRFKIEIQDPRFGIEIWGSDSDSRLGFKGIGLSDESAKVESTSGQCVKERMSSGWGID
jgi:hypothetical protein